MGQCGILMYKIGIASRYPCKQNRRGNGMSTKEFDEYEFKDISKRVKITYRRDSDERLNPWEITNFVSRVTTCIYKIERDTEYHCAGNQSGR